MILIFKLSELAIVDLNNYFRSLAMAGPCFIQAGIGIEFTCSTIIVGALASDKSKDVLPPLTDEQASWLGSFLFLFTPLGSALSSLMLNRFGHKTCMILINVPFLVSQIMLFYANSVGTLYVCSMLMGLSVGYSGGPTSAYIGEVCEPKLRGALMSVTNVFYYAGSFLFTLIYAFTLDWRLTVLIGMSIPIVNIVILFMTPQSPMWLLTKGKSLKAQRTLAKLRGWPSQETGSSKEFKEMIAFTSTAVHDNDDIEKDEKGATSSWGQLLRPEVYRPFRLLMVYFFYANLMSGVQYGPYLLQIFTDFGAPVNVEFTLAFSVLLSTIGGILTIFFISKFGKRFLTLSALLICSICYIMIGLIGVYWTNSKPLTAWLVLIFFLTTIFLASFGIMPIAWILLSEIFPMKSRNITCSAGTAFGYLMTFFMIKYYLDFSNFVNFYNTFTIFGISGLFGAVYFYFYLPETENKTLQDISAFFK
ncbi:facilitated trehalose transporter Tret1 isoform X2 [Acyrthosiphon pisum]|uniref:Major facilitator superfamily (MFS) profile domain-containing protein n=1 Tax=Acyrthosiphon pisum TaxID=7029 RepID=A0A8R2F9C2_ACYPI|nr:facilitated trehalose transporter Tret1 isoform X2 [Acyrthosiphon pisum]|eukprot:XP_008184642.1 PREDICTED: facilitated trehalose transporter Tret1 isoform X2 [Acyrthosiphon pisum]